MLVNIPKNINDVFYRYKRHLIELQFINKKNGIFLLKNISLIAKEINRSEKQIIQFISKKLGMRINKNELTSKNITVEQIEQLLELFIIKNVLCNVCNNPETDPINFRCKACGNKNDKKMN